MCVCVCVGRFNHLFPILVNRLFSSLVSQNAAARFSLPVFALNKFFRPIEQFNMRQMGRDPLLFSRDHISRRGLAAPSPGFRNIYLPPLVSLHFYRTRFACRR